MHYVILLVTALFSCFDKYRSYCVKLVDNLFRILVEDISHFIKCIVACINSYSVKYLVRYFNISLGLKVGRSIVSVLFKWTASQQVN
jgi:hypothetical protein